MGNRQGTSTRTWLLIGGALLLIGAVGGAGWWFSASFDPVDRQMAEQRPAWRPADRASPTEEVTEDYLSGTVTLAVTENTEVRDFPSISGGAVVRQQALGTTVTGRWVRGADPNARWLRLSTGGYLHASSLNQPAAAQSETAAPNLGEPVALSISNRDCEWGSALESYYDRVIAQRRHAFADNTTVPEDMSFFASVPNRRWRGLTVTGVAIHYESSSIYFREPVDVVRRALAAAGVTVGADGGIPIRSEEAVEVQSIQTTSGEAARYGATDLNCGV
jgi:hypothetical protein